VNSDTIEVFGKGFRYSALVGPGLMARAGQLARKVVSGNRGAIIADETSSRLFGDRICQSFSSENFSPRLIGIPSGEKSKSLAQVEKICDEMIEAGLDRSSFVVGLGGGVIGDISGFVAAIFQRGIPHIQIPTTLLAMVDSSIGGKTGVNLEAGKNLIGAIHHPALIIADVEALESLPLQELRQGYAEIIKHAIIRDAEMFQALSSRAKPPVRLGLEGSRCVTLKLSWRDPSTVARDDGLVSLIRRNLAIKARIVAADAREISGERALLNFGHTVGHAIERATGFKIPHGDCISIGMVAACEISMKRVGLSSQERDEVVSLLKQFELPTQLPANVDREKIIATVVRDKKFIDGKIRFVVTPRIGEAHVSNDVTMEDIREAIAAL
jgi:3-dehydroquinate synthase